MSTNQTFNGVTYPIPTQADLRWAPPLTRYLVALGTYALNPGGGSYPLTASLNLSGGGFGVLADYFSGPLAGIASQGRFRMTKTGMVAWRNNAGGGDNLLATDASDNLTWNGTAVPVGLSTLADGKIWIGSVGNLPTAQTLTGDVTVTNAGVTAIGAGKIVDAQINNSAAIQYSKLSLTGSILNADIYASAAIAYSKLALTGSILNADINASAAIAYSKLALTGAILNADISASAAIDAAKIGGGAVSNTEFSYLDGVTSAIQTQIDGKQATGNYITALTSDITASGPGSVAATLATVNSNVGSFTSANITVNAKGLITAAANGGGGGTVTSVSGTANQITSTGGATPVLAIASPVTFPGAMTAGGALAMGANKITGLANGTTSTDAVAFGQLKKQILQIVTVTTTSSTSTSSATYQATGLTTSFTPQSASSTIMFWMSGQWSTPAGVAASTSTITLARGGTNLGATNGFSQLRILEAATAARVPVSLVFSEASPGTSAVTYDVRIANDNSVTLTFNDDGGTAVLIIVEVL